MKLPVTKLKFGSCALRWDGVSVNWSLVCAFLPSDPAKSFSESKDVLRETPRVMDPNDVEKTTELMWHFLQWRAGTDKLPGATEDEFEHAHGHNWHKKKEALVREM